MALFYKPIFAFAGLAVLGAAAGCASTADLALTDPGAIGASADSGAASSGGSGGSSPGGGGSGGGGGGTTSSGLLASATTVSTDKAGGWVSGVGALVSTMGGDVGALSAPLAPQVGGVLGRVGNGVETLGANLQANALGGTPLLGQQLDSTVNTLDAQLGNIVSASVLDIGGGYSPFAVTALSPNGAATGTVLDARSLSAGEVFSTGVTAPNGPNILSTGFAPGTSPSVNVLGNDVLAPLSAPVQGLAAPVQSLTAPLSGLTAGLTGQSTGGLQNALNLLGR